MALTPTVTIGLPDANITAPHNAPDKAHIWDGEERWLLGEPRKYAIPEEGDPWERCYQKVKDYDDDLCKGWRDQVEKLLIFAGLLAATVTAFIIDSYKNLREDPISQTNWLLEQVLLEIRSANAGNSTANPLLPTPPTFTPSALDIRLNIFWFMSLSLSLATVLIGILCSQWLREYQRYTRLPPVVGISVRQLRYDGLMAWKVPNILLSLPVLLQLSLILFFLGLLDLLWNLNYIVASFVTAVAGLAILFVVIATFLPSCQNYFGTDPRAPRCPYKSPQAWAVHRLIARFVRLSNAFRSPFHAERDAPFFKDKTWVDADKTWCAMKKRIDPTHRSNDMVRGLVWIDKHLENSVNMVFSIYHCIKSILPEESAQVVLQINKDAQAYFHSIEVMNSTAVADRREVNLALYLEEKCRIFPQLGTSHLDAVVRLLNTRTKHAPQGTDPPLFIYWPLYDVLGMPEDLVIQFLLCYKDLISLRRLKEEDANNLWDLIKTVARSDGETRPHTTYRRLALEIVMAMEGRLPTIESTTTGIQSLDADAKRAVKIWACHVIDLFQGWVPEDVEPQYELVLDALNMRLKDCGGPSSILSPKERRAWEQLSRHSSTDEKLG